MIYGYCCTYRNRLSPARQKILSLYPNAIIYTDALDEPELDFSNRPKLQQLLQKVVEKDTIVFPGITQLSSNAEECYQLYEKLFFLNVSLIFLRHPYLNTDTYKSQLKAVPAETMAAMPELLQAVQQSLDIYILSLAKEQIQVTYEQIKAQTIYSVSRRPQRPQPVNIDVLKAKKAILNLSSTFLGKEKDAWMLNFLDVSQRTLTKYKHELKQELNMELNDTSIQALVHIYARKIMDYYCEHPLFEDDEKKE